MSLNVGDLKNNLQNIYAGTYNSAYPEQPFVPNLKGTLIYDRSRGIGRFWHIIFLFICFIVGEQFKLTRLHAAVQKTHRTFHEQLKHITLHMEKFLKHLGAQCEGISVPEREIQASRRAITRWNDATFPFLQLLKKNKKTLNDLLKSSLVNEKENGLSQDFFLTELSTRLAQYQDMIDLEGELGEAMPWWLLKKAAMNMPISKEEVEKIGGWRSKLNQFATTQPAKLGLIRRALQSLIQHLKENHSKKFMAEPDFGRLVCKLLDLEFGIFHIPDPKHMRWREKLTTGSVFLCNQTKIVLGKQIGIKEQEGDRMLIFEIKDHPEHVVAIGINRLTLAIRQKLALEINAWNIKIVAMRELDELGRCAIMEKLSDPSGGKNWISTTRLIPTDVQCCQPLIAFVDACVRRRCTPINFAQKYMMLDEKGRITSIKILEAPSPSQRQFDFNGLEDFIFKASRENLMIFSFLMKETKLNEQRAAAFYQSVVREVLKGDVLDVEQRYHAYGAINDNEVLVRGKILYEETLQLSKRCLEKIRSTHPTRHLKTITEGVRKQLTRRYGDSNAAGILWPSLENDVIKDLT